MADKTTETKREQGLTLENKSEQVSKKLWFTDRVKSLLKVKSSGVVDAQNERMLNKQMKEHEIFPSDYEPSNNERRLYIKSGNKIYYLDSTLINQLSATDSILLDLAAIEASLATAESDISAIETDLLTKASVSDTRGTIIAVAPFIAGLTDPNTYYWALPTAAPTTAESAHRIYVPKAIHIKSACVFVRKTTAASAGNIEMYIRVDATTDYTITSTMAWTTAGFDHVENTSLNGGTGVPVAAGHFFAMKTILPTLTTDPVNIWMQAFLEYTID